MDKLFADMKVVGKDESKGLEGRERADITVRQYIARLKKLNDDKPFNSLAFLKDVDGIVDQIKTRVKSTQNSYYSAVIVALSNAKSHKALLEKYKLKFSGTFGKQSLSKNTFPFTSLRLLGSI
jgi:hypothetical protein